MIPHQSIIFFFNGGRMFGSTLLIMILTELRMEDMDKRWMMEIGMRYMSGY